MPLLFSITQTSQSEIILNPYFACSESDKAESFPGKDAVYRFLNHTKFAWRRSLSSLSVATIQKVERLTSDNRVTAFIFDDSMFDRNRSKAVKLLARFKDQATGAYYKGFRMLTMGWSDSHTFIPMDFALLSLQNRRSTVSSKESTNAQSGINAVKKRYFLLRR